MDSGSTVPWTELNPTFPRFILLDFIRLYKKKQGKEAENDPYAENTLITKHFPQLSEFGARIPLFESKEKSELQFLTASHRRRILDVKQSRYTWVRYSLETAPESDDEFDPNRAENVLVRTSVPEGVYRDEFDWEKERSNILLRHVKSLRFEYWKGKKGGKRTEGQYVERLNELDKESLPPRLIRLVVEWMPKGGEEPIEFKRSFKVLCPTLM